MLNTLPAAAPPPAANDDRAPVRMIPLIGEIHDGRFVRYDVVELLAVPVADLIAGRRRLDALSDDGDGRPQA